MTLSLYDTHVLLGVVRQIFPPQTFWLDRFFGTEQTFEQEYIDFDVLVGGRRMAPFVAPTVQGKPMLAQGYTTKRFKPAYIKPKDMVDPQRIIKRRAGEAFMGSLSLQARYDAVIADILQEQKNQIVRRWEWMACQAVVNGSVTVAGDDYPEVTVDFQRNSGQTVTNMGTSLWTDTVNSDPITDIETWTENFQLLTGFVVDQIIMGVTAFKAYRSHPKVQALLNAFYRGSSDIVARSALTTLPPTAQYVGQVGTGNVPIYVYNDLYEDAASSPSQVVTVPYMPTNYVVLTSSEGLAGLRCYGAIMDSDANYAATPIFPKNWKQQDPSVTYLMCQSAPLMVPTRPNCSFRAIVA